MSGDIAGMIDASGNPAGEEEEDQEVAQERPKEVKVQQCNIGPI